MAVIGEDVGILKTTLTVYPDPCKLRDTELSKVPLLYKLQDENEHVDSGNIKYYVISTAGWLFTFDVPEY